MQTDDCGSFAYAVLTSRSTTPRTSQNTIFINILINTSHWTPFWPRWLQFSPSQSISYISASILSSQLCLGLPSSLFPSGFVTKTFNTFLTVSTKYGHYNLINMTHPYKAYVYLVQTMHNHAVMVALA